MDQISEIKTKFRLLYIILGLMYISMGMFTTGCSGMITPVPTTVEILPSETVTSPITQTIATEPPVPAITQPATLEPTPVPTSLPTPPELPVPGIEVHSVPDVEMAAGLGAYWVRKNALQWSKIEPENGMRNWNEVAGLDHELIRISESGMQVILIVRGAPDWALQVPGRPCGLIQMEALDDFAGFLREAVIRYKQSPYNVKYWELGNEPDVDPSLTSPTSPFGCWGDANDPNYYGGAYYAEMLKAAYPAIKAGDPEAKVFVGGLLMDCDPVNPPETSPGSGELRYCTPSRYLEGILANGGGDYFDGVSFHAYDYYYGAEGQYGNGNWYSSWNTTGPVTAAKVSYIRSLLASFGYTDKLLVNSETALICGRNGKEPECQTDIFQKTKAYYAVESSTMALAEGLKANIWYDLRGWRGSGLIDSTRQTLPAFQAYQFNTILLSKMSYGGKISNNPGITGYEFRQGERIIWVLWSLDGMTHDVQVPGSVSMVYDTFGNQVGKNNLLSVTLAPIYVEWTTGNP